MAFISKLLNTTEQNYCMDGGKEDTKERGKGDGMRIGIDGKIPRDEET